MVSFGTPNRGSHGDAFRVWFTRTARPTLRTFPTAPCLGNAGSKVKRGLKEVNRSGYMYGLPDLSALTMATSGDRNKLIRQILAAVNLFEPRLANVRLTWVETPDTVKSEVRLRIEAMLRMDPSPEPISFDTVIELKSGSCRLSGGDDAR